jgi:hypothetical protein
MTRSSMASPDVIVDTFAMNVYNNFLHQPLDFRWTIESMFHYFSNLLFREDRNTDPVLLHALIAHQSQIVKSCIISSWRALEYSLFQNVIFALSVTVLSELRFIAMKQNLWVKKFIEYRFLNHSKCQNLALRSGDKTATRSYKYYVLGHCLSSCLFSKNSPVSF